MEVEAQVVIISSFKHVCDEDPKDKAKAAAAKKTRDQLRYKLKKRMKHFKATVCLATRARIGSDLVFWASDEAPADQAKQILVPVTCDNRCRADAGAIVVR